MPCKHGCGAGPYHCQACAEEFARERRRRKPQRSLLAQYLWNLLISLDQFLNALMGGDPDETVSSRCARILHTFAESGTRAPWFWHKLGRILEFLDPGHLKRSLEKDEGFDETFTWRP